MLHITNGDNAVALMHEAGLSGEYLPWRDILHEGPVPAGLDLSELSEVRARFIADCGWGGYTDVLAEFRHRDARLIRCLQDEEVVLWFEHDLYDQLQILQILDWLAVHAPEKTRLSLICIAEHPEVDSFHGLADLLPHHMGPLLEQRSPLTRNQVALASAGWRAFGSADPRDVEGFLRLDTAVLPFLAPALRRHLEEFPGLGDGLSRTQRTILEVLAAGPCNPIALFRRAQAREPARFMGDWPFWRHLQQLSRGPAPLVRTDQGPDSRFPPRSHTDKALQGLTVRLTAAGKAALEGRLDHTVANGIDRWLGGVHLTPDSLWRWDERHARLMSPGALS